MPNCAALCCKMLCYAAICDSDLKSMICSIILLSYVVLGHNTLCCNRSQYVIPCSTSIRLYYATLCGTVLYYATTCCTMLYGLTSCCIIFFLVICMFTRLQCCPVLRRGVANTLAIPWPSYMVTVG